MPTVLKDNLSKVFKGELEDDEQTLATFSRDASIYEIKPQLVASPTNSEDIKSLIKYINEHPDQNLSITPRAAGTCMSGGAIGETIILNTTKHLNKVISVSDSSAITQPGVLYKDYLI